MKRDPEIVTVFETGNAALIALAKSILDNAGIRYIVKGEQIQSLFGWGVLGTGFNIVVGPVQIQVSRTDRLTARDLLADLHEGTGAPT